MILTTAFIVARNSLPMNMQDFLMTMPRLTLLVFLCSLLSGTSPVFAQSPPVQSDPAPDIRIISFSAERGYIVGASPVILLCVIKNMGVAPLPEKTLRVRCFALSGLDYTSGETRPVLPALAPKQTIAFRWQLGVRETKGALVAGALIEAVGALPPNLILPGNRSVVTTIPRLSRLPAVGTYNPKPLDPPKASEEGFIGNERVALWVFQGERQQPALLLAVREEASWRAVTLAVPLLAIQSGEEGQQPWWETFRWRNSTVKNETDSATLTLNGTFGTRWKANLTFEAKRDTSAIDVTLRLIPIRPVRLYGVRLPNMIDEFTKPETTTKADGSEIGVTYSEPVLPENSPVVANRTNGITYGMTWTENSPFPNGTWEPSPLANSILYPVLGAQWTAPASGLLILPGATVEISFRVFALSASETVKDALRFVK